jgi:ElaA protein
VVDLHSAPLAALDPATLYAILRLRSEVFVVEQDCPYLDLDGRDAEPSALLLWATAEDGMVVATLRLLTDEGGCRRIGRVATAPAARGSGVAGRLMRQAISLAEGAPIVLDAQTYLVRWYEGFGFAASGPEFLDDGIPHLPMRREPTSTIG